MRGWRPLVSPPEQRVQSMIRTTSLPLPAWRVIRWTRESHLPPTLTLISVLRQVLLPSSASLSSARDSCCCCCRWQQLSDCLSRVATPVCQKSLSVICPSDQLSLLSSDSRSECSSRLLLHSVCLSRRLSRVSRDLVPMMNPTNIWINVRLLI